MQDQNDDAELLADLLKPAVPGRAATGAPALSSRAKAEAARTAALKALRHWGHMRCSELARVVYPHARYGEQLAQRLMQKLSDERGEVVGRSNALGTKSYVLSRVGAAALEAMGWETHHGLDLSSVAGATFLHRTMATRAGVEKALQGFSAYGEHAMAQGFGPITREALAKRFGKLPDLLLVKNGVVTWCEVEAAAKPMAELQACVRIAEFAGAPILPFTKLELGRLLFVFDGSQGHAQRIARAAGLQWREHGRHERERLAQRVGLVHVELKPLARWQGMRETPLAISGRAQGADHIKPRPTPDRSTSHLAE